jgi:hypothetical protein
MTIPKHVLWWVDDLPTLAKAQADDLKIDTGDDLPTRIRVWSSRVTVADGDGVSLSVELYDDGTWREVYDDTAESWIRQAIKWHEDHEES